MRKLYIFVLVVMVCIFSAVASADTIFDEKFMNDNNLYENGIVGTQSMTVIHDNVFNLLSNGDIYRWDSSQKTYSLFSKVQPIPAVNVEIPYSKQPDDVKAQLNNCVFSLISDGEQLYGVNLISGAIGRIMPDGITWESMHLDVTLINQNDQAIPQSILYAFIYKNFLFGYYDMSSATGGTTYEPAILQFDLSTGECTMISCPGSITMCHYKDDTVLMLKDQGTSIPTFSLYNISTSQYTPLAIDAPFAINRDFLTDLWDILSSVGGLAYDPESDTIYLANSTGLWTSTGKSTFQEIKQFWQSIMPLGEAWTLSNGIYVFHNGTVYVSYDVQ